MDLRSGKNLGEEEVSERGSDIACLYRMLKEMERKRQEERKVDEARRDERDELRKEERKRDEERREESKIQFEILQKQNSEIMKTLKERFKDMEIFKKAVGARVVQTEKQGEETRKVVRTNQEKCENRSKLLWEEMNRIQEDSQHRKLKENEQRLKENEENRTYQVMQNLKDGNAIFTFPNSSLKCPETLQKTWYLTYHFLRKVRKRDKVKITYNTSLTVIFGGKKYADVLWNICKERNYFYNIYHSYKMSGNIIKIIGEFETVPIMDK